MGKLGTYARPRRVATCSARSQTRKLSQGSRTLLDEHFRIEGRKTWFEIIEEVQVVLDDYLVGYNTKRPYQSRGMNGRTPIKAFVAAIPQPQRKEVATEMKSAA